MTDPGGPQNGGIILGSFAYLFLNCLKDSSIIILNQSTRKHRSNVNNTTRGWLKLVLPPWECLYIYIYMCVCVCLYLYKCLYIYMFIYINNNTLGMSSSNEGAGLMGT